MKMMITMTRTITSTPRYCRCFLQFTTPALLTLGGLIYLLQIDLIGALGDNQTGPQNAMNMPRGGGGNGTAMSGDKCSQMNRSCLESRGASLAPATSQAENLTTPSNGPACYCDQNCQLYDDCCENSAWAEAASKRVEMGSAKLRARRQEWLCRRVDPAMADIYLRASCHPDWVRQQKSNSSAELVKLKCELGGAAKDLLDPSDADWLQSDPLANLMPITDLANGITYANSFCLRCNSFDGLQSVASSYAPTTVAPLKLILWSPVISCNNKLNPDDRRALHDLISIKRAGALVYSRSHNKWFVDMPHVELMNDTTSSSQANQTTASAATTGDKNESNSGMEPVCILSPRIPDSARETIRHCRARTVVDDCPITSSLLRLDKETKPLPTSGELGKTVDELERAQYECQFGHQSLVYSKSSVLTYYNPGCAKCNLDSQVTCEPQISKQLDQTAPSYVRLPIYYGRGQEDYSSKPAGNYTTPNTSLPLPSWPSPTNIQQMSGNQTGLDGPSGNTTSDAAEADDQAPVSGSFSVLMDLYGGTQSDEQVGSTRRCTGERKVFDPFLLACRCIVCGVSYRFKNGACVHVSKLAGGGRGLPVSSLLMDSPTNTTTVLPIGGSGQAIGSMALNESSTHSPTNRVNGSSANSSATSDERLSSSGLPDSGEVARSATSSDQREPQQQQQQQQAGSGGKRVGREERHNNPTSASETIETLAQTDGSDNLFVTLFSELISDQPPTETQSIESSRGEFAECNKILIQPEHYRLFDMSELNASLASSSSSSSSVAAERLANRHTWDQESYLNTWALVAHYNLTLAPGQFEPVVRAGGGGRQRQQQLGLLICSPFKSELAEKPAMLYLTTCCLAVSTTSLVLYLLLYWLSTFDWRQLVVKLSDTGQKKNSLGQIALNSAIRESRALAETSYNVVKSQSLTSRRIACLVVALTCAYLLYMLGHYHQSALVTGGTEAGPTSCSMFPQAQPQAQPLLQSEPNLDQHQTMPIVDALGSNPFVALFSKLIATQPKVPPIESSRRAFAECSKILIQPEHYRLFDMSELNISLASSSSSSSSLVAAEWLASRPNPHSWDQESQRDTWALVAPHNLTLAPGQFKPVQQAGGRQQLGLLVCSSFKSDLVDKFKPAMVYLTTGCLLVSITSLVLYLLLHWLSTFDLRHLVLDSTQAKGQTKDSFVAINTAFRESRTCAESSYNATRSQSLSSRGVASLAGALLAAYLLFVVGHHNQSSAPVSASNAEGVFNCCARIAAATYFSFLLAFNWMFLLSYDIWRTLRLATHHLRVPTIGPQTNRYLIYATLAALAAGSMVLLALITDQIGLSLDCPSATATVVLFHGGLQQTMEQQANCSRLLNPIEQMIQTYRPKFGQRAGSCWFSNRRSLALFFGLPVTLIMLINLLFFLHSSFMVIKTSSRSSRRLKPTNSTWSQASKLTSEFAKQNTLTISSVSSVQTNQSMLSTTECQQDQSLDSPSLPVGRQNDIDETVKQVCEREPEPEPVSDTCASLEQTKQAGFNGSMGGNSQISFTDQLLASDLVHKYDLHLSSLGSVMSSLAKDYRLYCRLSTIMGLTWLTGLAASLVDQSDVLWYLFVVLNSLQGLFIFVAFGLKRSRLTNLRILILHIDHKLKQKFLREDSGNRSKT